MVKRVGVLTTRLLLSNSHVLSARVVPICPELRALMPEAIERAGPGATLTGPMASRPGVNLRTYLERIPESLIEVLSLDAEAEALAAEYIRDGAVGKNQRADALHIAIATVARVDVLVSWNFKHIVNLRRIHAFNAVNLKQGYPVLEIRNPREVIGDE
jgi:hypothetical protein